ncbi:MAG: BtrH N-terminal domain-containing protein [Bacteroidetes bacterium]|nr:BtrH N-terminal domain-containing protein [Bacteroidota bacterium]
MIQSSLKQIPFIHHQHAHCESGVTSNLLMHEGIHLSEPLAFGIGAGIFFAHLPFIKVSGVPGTTFRTWPGAIFKRVAQRLKISVHTEKFRSPEKAMLALDKVLQTVKPVGMLSSVYFLPYLPEAFRFHFNAHNLIIYGKEGNQYLVSDPVLENQTNIAPEDLAKARFAKGMPEPRGFMYYITNTPPKIDFQKAIQEGIKQTCFFMLSPPLPWFGNRAIGFLAEKIKSYPSKLPPRKASLYLGNIIRMQEEIGTGGAGFRYLYAAFLQEAGEKLHRDDLIVMSHELTAIGDDWRNFAYHAARQMKARQSDLVSFDELSALLKQCGIKEKDFFQRLQKVKW